MSRVYLIRQVDSEGHVEYKDNYVPLEEAPPVKIYMGNCGTGPRPRAWWEVPLPQCPDCGGDIVWWEAGYAPGTRMCVGEHVDEKGGQKHYYPENGCGSIFSIYTKPEKG